jgi:hypothetical protein
MSPSTSSCSSPSSAGGTGDRQSNSRNKRSSFTHELGDSEQDHPLACGFIDAYRLSGQEIALLSDFRVEARSALPQLLVHADGAISNRLAVLRLKG